MPQSVSCPGCREPLDVDDEYRAWKVRCPRCGTEFVPDEPRPPRPAEALVARPRRPRDEDDDYDDRPRRRRRRWSEADDYREAAAEVYGPSVFLELLGWLGALASAALAFLFIVVGLAPQPGKQNQQPEEVVAAFLLGGCFGVLGIGIHATMIIGARHMRALSSRSWAMAGAILALLAMGLLHLSAGLWAIVVLNRPHVRDAFDYHARHGGPPDDE